MRLIACGIIKTASQKLKPSKTEPLLCVTYDFFVNAPIILYDHLSIIMKCYFDHGHVSDFLLISTLVPIVKDKLSDTQVVTTTIRSLLVVL